MGFSLPLPLVTARSIRAEDSYQSYESSSYAQDVEASVFAFLLPHGVVQPKGEKCFAKKLPKRVAARGKLNSKDWKRGWRAMQGGTEGIQVRPIISKYFAVFA